MCLHRVNHHPPGPAAAQGFHQCRRHGFDEVRVDANGRERTLRAHDQIVHGPGGAEHADRDEDGDEIGNDLDDDREALFGAVDECLVHVDLAHHRQRDERGDDAEENHVGGDSRDGCDLFLGKPREVDDDRHDRTGEAAEVGQDHPVKQVDALYHGNGDQTGQRGEEGGQQDRNEDVGRVGGTELRAIDHDADRNQREARRVQHQEHDLGVRGRVGLGVQFLQLLHSLQPERRRRVVESKHIGGEVHDHRPVHRMVPGDLGKQPVKERPHDLRQDVDRAAPLAHAHQSQPQREHSRQAE